jgi:hypothetical protein
VPLIECPECKHQVSDKAAACPQCGCPLASTASLKLADEARTAPGPAQPKSDHLTLQLISLGLLGIIYRLFWTMEVLWFVSCCTCGGLAPGSKTLDPGFLGAWNWTGIAFERARDTYGTIVYFGAWRWVTWACVGLVMTGVLRAIKYGSKP